MVVEMRKSVFTTAFNSVVDVLDSITGHLVRRCFHVVLIMSVYNSLGACVRACVRVRVCVRTRVPASCTCACLGVLARVYLSILTSAVVSAQAYKPW